jgi:hypothetical protein
LIGHDIKPIRQRYLLHLLPNGSNQIFDNVSNFMTTDLPRVVRIIVSPRHECHLEINLSELGLPILATILIPEAPSELIVSVNGTRAHEELLGLLRGLWECEEEGCFRPAGEGISSWDKELASAFGGRLEENWRFNLEEI